MRQDRVHGLAISSKLLGLGEGARIEPRGVDMSASECKVQATTAGCEYFAPVASIGDWAAKLTLRKTRYAVRIILCAIALTQMCCDLAWGDNQTAKRIRVDGKTQRSKLIHEVLAEYPPEAREHHIEGVVHLKAIIATDGTIKELEALSGHPLLVKAALEAVRQWKYQPTEVKGEPVEVITGIAVVFKLP